MTNNNIAGTSQVAQAGRSYLQQEVLRASYIVIACEELQNQEWSCNGTTLVIGSGRDQHIVTLDVCKTASHKEETTLHCTCSRFNQGYECWHLSAFRIACELIQVTA